MKNLFNHHGLVGPKHTGNGLLFTAHYALLLHKCGGLTEEIKEQIKVAVLKCELLPGLWMRTPDNKFGIQSFDDHIGIGTLSVLLDPSISERIIRRGQTAMPIGPDLEDAKMTDKGKRPEVIRRNKILYLILRPLGLLKYHYNNIFPLNYHVSGHMLRMPHVICHHKLAAGIHAGILERSAWCLNLLITSFQMQRLEDTDGLLLSWHMDFVASESKQCGLVMRISQKLWSYAAKRKGLSNTFKQYFGAGHGLHELAMRLK